MKGYTTKILLLMVMLMIPAVAKANMIWPSIFILEQYYTWYIITVGLAVEIVFAWRFLKVPFIRAVWIMFVTNAVSAVLGLLLIPISGIFAEIMITPFSQETFNLSHWVVDYIAVVICNTYVEGYALKLIFKYPFKQNLRWLLIANSISVFLCVFVPIDFNENIYEDELLND